MIEPHIEFPLSLRPVVRSRQGGDRHASFVPYHAAIWIVDANGHDVIDVAPDINDLRGGRLSEDAHKLVARASRLVVWLEAVQSRLMAVTAPMDSATDLLVRPLLRVGREDRTVELGVQFLSAPNEEFDRVSRSVDLFASDAAVDAIVELISGRASRRHEAALTILQTVREAIESWRSAEQVAASVTDPLVIDDVRLED